MANREIIIKREQFKKTNLNFPKIGPWGKILTDNKNKTALVIKSVTSEKQADLAELHENYTDIFIIFDGREELHIGGKILDKKPAGAGEWIGKKLKGAKKYDVKAGDMVIIPKGIAHRHGRGVIKLLVVKIA